MNWSIDNSDNTDSIRLENGCTEIQIASGYNIYLLLKYRQHKSIRLIYQGTDCTRLERDELVLTAGPRGPPEEG